jgi:hypothetical protein
MIIMTYFEAMGEAELQRAEGSRQIALALAGGIQALWHAAARRLALALNHLPHPSPRS